MSSRRIVGIAAMNQGFTHRERLAARADGVPLVTFLVDEWRRGGVGEWRERLARGEVRLDGSVPPADARLRAGQLLEWQRPPWVEPAVPLSFALLFRDEHLLAVAKPSGLPTMPSGHRFLTHTLLHQVRRRWPEAAPLHRLDRGTSGLVLFGRTALARREGGRRWQRGEVRRLYVGLIEGAPAQDEFTLDLPIGEQPDPRIGRVFVAAPGGRASRTHVTVLERRAGETLVGIEIGSGRPHQIRIHLAAAGHPLVGEPFYAVGGAPRPTTTAFPGDTGYLLHAWRLELRHPGTDAPLALECAPPLRLRPDAVACPPLLAGNTP